jgi:hypothetical protein
MPSSISFSTSTTTKSAHSIYTRPQKKQKMSITQTYFLAHSARGKLSKEAARADHDLRLLVGHANMLDSLMLDLANAEQEQERWFNKTVSGTEEEEEEVAHIETIQEEPEVEEAEVDSDVEEDDDSDSEELALTRTPSRHSPPALTMDVDSESDDESMPPSPPQPALDTLSEKERQAIATTSFYESSISSNDFYDPREQPIAVAAY